MLYANSQNKQKIPFVWSQVTILGWKNSEEHIDIKNKWSYNLWAHSQYAHLISGTHELLLLWHNRESENLPVFHWAGQKSVIARTIKHESCLPWQVTDLPSVEVLKVRLDIFLKYIFGYSFWKSKTKNKLTLNPYCKIVVIM